MLVKTGSVRENSFCISSFICQQVKEIVGGAENIVLVVNGEISALLTREFLFLFSACYDADCTGAVQATRFEPNRL